MYGFLRSDVGPFDFDVGLDDVFELLVLFFALPVAVTEVFLQL